MTTPRAAVAISAFLAIVLLLSMVWASAHGPVHPVLEPVLEPCAAVQVRGQEQTCR